MLVAGVNLRASERYASHLAVLDPLPQVIHVGTFHTNAELLDLVQEWQLTLVAIGSPLSMPLGLDDLEPSSEPRSPVVPKGRQAERELAQVGISYFFTGRGSINRRQIYRGMELREQVRQLRTEVIEVYPYATRVILLGDKAPSIRSARGLALVKELLVTRIKQLEPHIEVLDQGACDALLNAYVATLHCRGDSEALGTPEEGLIVTPSWSRAASNRA